MEKDEIKSALLHAIEVSLDVQHKAVERYAPDPASRKLSVGVRRSMSQIDMVGDVLLRAEKLHGREIEREPIVLTLVKKVKRGDRFVVCRTVGDGQTGPPAGAPGAGMWIVNNCALENLHSSDRAMCCYSRRQRHFPFPLTPRFC